MRPARTARPPGLWDVARPARPGGLQGVDMAGFRDRGGPTRGPRAIAHPSVTLVVDLGSQPLVVADGSGASYCGSLVAGMGFGAVRITGSGFEALQVRLSPVVATSVLGVCLTDLTGGIVRLDDLWGPRAERLRDQVHDASWQSRFEVVEAALTDLVGREGRSPDPEVSWAWARIRRSRGVVRVESLAAEVGWSRRRLWSRFRAQIGLPPKRAASLVRFDAAAHGLASGMPPARVAADTGYTDQSHLHREVLAFSGVTPANVAKEPWLAVDDDAWQTIAGRRHPSAASGLD